MLLQANVDHSLDGLIDFLSSNRIGIVVFFVLLFCSLQFFKVQRKKELLAFAEKFFQSHNLYPLFTKEEKILCYNFSRKIQSVEKFVNLFLNHSDQVIYLCINNAYLLRADDYETNDIRYTNTKIIAALQRIRRSGKKKILRFAQEVVEGIIANEILKRSINSEHSSFVLNNLFWNSPQYVSLEMNWWDKDSKKSMETITEHILDSEIYKKLVGKECDMIREETKEGFVTEKVLQLMKEMHPAKTKTLFRHTLDIALRDACIRNWNLEKGNFGTLELMELANSYRSYAMALSGLCCC